MNFLPGEQLVAGQPSGGICVTTHRVRSSGSSWGNENVEEIFLEHISFVSVQMSSTPPLLLLAILFGMIGLIMMVSTPGPGILALVVAALCVGGYFVTRRQVVVVASGGGRIEVSAGSLPRDTRDHLLQKLSEAKTNRARHFGHDRAAA